jgi:acetoacetyl-CoA synthetase
MAGTVLWAPTPERIAACELTRFYESVARRHGVRAATPGSVGGTATALHSWSVSERELFWREIWQLGKGVIGEGALEPTLLADRMPGARWFPHARLNFAENCLRRGGEDDADANAVAIIASVEGAPASRRTLSWLELRTQVAVLAARLRSLGVGPGVRCAAYVPNVPEAVVAMLAVTSLGGVWASCSPDFGHSAVLDRLGQVEPHVLFVCDAYTYKGRQFDRMDEVERVLAGLPSVAHCVVVSPGAGAMTTASTAAPQAQFHTLDAWLLPEVAGPAAAPPVLEFERLPFGAPLYVMFSSGTTGAPKR